MPSVARGDTLLVGTSRGKQISRHAARASDTEAVPIVSRRHTVTPNRAAGGAAFNCAHQECLAEQRESAWMDFAFDAGRFDIAVNALDERCRFEQIIREGNLVDTSVEEELAELDQASLRERASAVGIWDCGELRIRVPVGMEDEIGNFRGSATYSNFRRFNVRTESTLDAPDSTTPR